jgi:hypothetical protein
MVGCKATQKSLLTHRNLHFFTFNTKAAKPVKAVIRHFPDNSSSEHITVVLQQLDLRNIIVKQKTEGVTDTPLPLTLVTVARN